MRLSDDVIHISFRREDFHISFGHPFLLVFAATLLLSEVLFVSIGNDSQQILFLVLPGLVTILCATAIALLKIRCIIQVSRDGIACYDVWSRPQRISWDVVQHVERVQSVGFSYLKVSARGSGKAFWVPMFVSRERQMEELLTLYLGANAPVQLRANISKT